MAEFRYDVIVLALFKEFLNLQCVTWFNAPINLHNLLFHLSIFCLRLGAKIGIMFVVLMTIQKKSHREQVFLANEKIVLSA